MSRKNHKMVDGKLLQTDKKYSHLKLKQKEKIYVWMFEETKRYHDNNGKCPEKKNEDAAVVDAVYDRIEQAEIWIPYGEVYKHYKSLILKIRNYAAFTIGSLIVCIRSYTFIWQKTIKANYILP